MIGLRFFSLPTSQTNKVIEFNVGVRLYASRSKNQMIIKPACLGKGYLITKKGYGVFSHNLKHYKYIPYLNTLLAAFARHTTF